MSEATKSHGSDDFSYDRYALVAGQPVSREFVDLYRTVFEDPPWNEYRACLQCPGLRGSPKRKFSRVEASQIPGSNCPTCTTDLVPYFSDDDIVSDISTCLNGKNPSCWFVRYQGELIGFTYGAEMTADELEHDLRSPGLAQSLLNAFGSGKRYAYQDEIAVRSDFRKRGLAKELFERRLQDFRSMHIDIGVVRTKTLPQSVTFSWYVRRQYAVVASYQDADARVVLAASFDTLEGM